MTMSWLYL